ncbi:ABC transporter permease [Sporosarcina sp. ACRSL]|uniref:ABC transporter permease n=1 Tax=Sporosarcina sp. ACRSL TaxID=2918215 RepID=UPI001EF54AD5|nr:ABC transporter permease [Sporosarcina sp. ACRSL]MCG7344561.1 ABC transporter permease [Sporosarcina sp. ACRSL]
MIRMPAQLFRLKKEWKSVICWLLAPIFLTVVVMKTFGLLQEESKVPIALIVEEQSALAAKLAEEIEKNDMLAVHYLELDDALHKLKQHELDSVFVIREGYEESVLANRRNGLIEAYSSNRSFAYPAISETVMSLAQQDISRAKAAMVIRHLYQEYGMEDEWNYDEIIQRSEEKQRNESLLHTSFSYGKQTAQSDEKPMELLNSRAVWAFFTMIAAFFIFDWMIKESRPSMKVRWLYTSTSFKSYALRMLALYSLLTILSDGIALFVFHFVLHDSISLSFILPMLVFRMTLNLFAFLLAIVYRHLFMYYITGIAVSLLLTVTGGAVVPLDALSRQLQWIEFISPVRSLLTMTIPIVWLFALLVVLVIWRVKGGKQFA